MINRNMSKWNLIHFGPKSRNGYAIKIKLSGSFPETICGVVVRTRFGMRARGYLLEKSLVISSVPLVNCFMVHSFCSIFSVFCHLFSFLKKFSFFVLFFFFEGARTPTFTCSRPCTYPTFTCARPCKLSLWYKVEVVLMDADFLFKSYYLFMMFRLF